MNKKYVENVRKHNPLIHNITNYVTANDVANVLLACGASPIMADDYEEVEDITSICNALNINIGTLNNRTIKSMLRAGKKSNELKHITVFDPVGAGASKLRTETAKHFISEINFDAIKGNISEINAIFKGTNTTNGVDANMNDIITEENKQEKISFIKKIAQKTNSIIIVTGAIDIVSNGEKTFLIRNGRKEMKSITGIGCQLSALIAAFISANPNCKLEAASYALIMMGIAGELAWTQMDASDGNVSYRQKIIDCIYNMTDEIIKKEANYEIR